MPTPPDAKATAKLQATPTAILTRIQDAQQRLAQRIGGIQHCDHHDYDGGNRRCNDLVAPINQYRDDSGRRQRRTRGRSDPGVKRACDPVMQEIRGFFKRAP
jgi:hypothetical protein